MNEQVSNRLKYPKKVIPEAVSEPKQLTREQ